MRRYSKGQRFGIIVILQSFHRFIITSLNRFIVSSFPLPSERYYAVQKVKKSQHIIDISVQIFNLNAICGVGQRTKA
jgi:hypothetical protein